MWVNVAEMIIKKIITATGFFSFNETKRSCEPIKTEWNAVLLGERKKFITTDTTVDIKFITLL